MKKPLDLSSGIFEPQYEQIHDIYNVIRVPALSLQPNLMSPGFSYRIPKGSFVYLEIHFAPSGKLETEKLALNLSGSRSGRGLTEYRLRDFAAHDFVISPRQEEVSVSTSRPVKHSMLITAIGAHMHWRGKWAQLKLRSPSGQEKIIYSGRYLFKNRERYELDQPVFAAAGSAFLAEFQYDNSKANPAKIDSDLEVHEGIDAFKNEMGVFHIEYYKASKDVYGSKQK